MLKTINFRNRELRVRPDLWRFSCEAAEVAGFAPESVYSFFFKVGRDMGVNPLNLQVQVSSGRIWIDEKNSMVLYRPESDSAPAFGGAYTPGAAYWEGRILARQEDY